MVNANQTFLYVTSVYQSKILFGSGLPEVVKWGVLMTFFGVAPSFNLEILGVLNDTILPILRNIGGAIAPLVPVPLWSAANFPHLLQFSRRLQ